MKNDIRISRFAPRLFRQFAQGLAALVIMAVTTGHAQAALIGVVNTFPAVSLTASPYLLYDHNAVNATTGQLRMFTGSSMLAEGAAAGGSTLTQSYFSSTDSIPNLMLTINVNNTTGAFVNGNVNIGYGTNPANTSKFSWMGTITNFGFNNSGSGSPVFDATWTMTGDQYQAMPATLSQFVNGYLTGGAGGLKINSSAGFGGATHFGNDWIYGSAATTTSALNTFISGMTSPQKINSTVTASVFASPVPELDSVWLMLAGLAGAVPLARRRNTHKNTK